MICQSGQGLEAEEPLFIWYCNCRWTLKVEIISKACPLAVRCLLGRLRMGLQCQFLSIILPLSLAPSSSLPVFQVHSTVASGMAKFFHVSRRLKVSSNSQKFQYFLWFSLEVMQSHSPKSPRPTQIQEEQTQMKKKCQHHWTHGWDTLVWPFWK